MERTIPTRAWHVVIENANRDRALAQAAALGGAGCTVLLCGGPDAPSDGSCPLPTDGACPWIESADVVLHDLDLDDPVQREILGTLRRAYPGVPVVLELPEATARDHGALLAGCHVIYPFDMDHLVQAVIDAATTADPASTPASHHSERPRSGAG